MTERDKTSDAGEAFALFYNEYLEKVLRYIQYRVNDIQLAEDLTSAVFEKALTNFGKYSDKKASFATWIFTIARNVVIDHYRLSRKRQSVSLEEVAAQSSGEKSPEEELERKDERERLHMCLAELAEDEQEIVRLKFGAELNNRQIAKMLGQSESNVGTKLYRAIRKMRSTFRGSENG